MKALIIVTAPPSPLDRLLPDGILRLCGVPALELQIELLRLHGVQEILLMLGHGNTTVAHHFGNGRRFGVRMASLCSAAAIPTAGDLHAIHGFLDDSVLLLSGNVLVAGNLHDLHDEHHRHRAEATIALSGATGHCVDGDLMAIEPAALQELPAATCMTGSQTLATALADNGCRVHRARLALDQQSITTPARYLEAHWRCLHGEWPDLDHGLYQRAPGLYCGINVSIDPRRCEIEGPVRIDGGARIEDGASLIGPCHIGAGVVIETGASIERSIVLPRVRVSGHAHLCEAMTDANHCLLADGSTIDLARADLSWLIGDCRQALGTRAASEQRFLDHVG